MLLEFFCLGTPEAFWCKFFFLKRVILLRATLMAPLKINYKIDYWKLFIDSSNTSLKALWLHNGNVSHSIPIGHSVHLKETYENITQFLRCIHCDQNKWFLCYDLKVVTLLLRLQVHTPSTVDFLCERDSCARKDHYIKHDWPTSYQLAANNLRKVHESQCNNNGSYENQQITKPTT